MLQQLSCPFQNPLLRVEGKGSMELLVLGWLMTCLLEGAVMSRVACSGMLGAKLVSSTRALTINLFGTERWSCCQAFAACNAEFTRPWVGPDQKLPCSFLRGASVNRATRAGRRTSQRFRSRFSVRDLKHNRPISPRRPFAALRSVKAT